MLHPDKAREQLDAVVLKSAEKRRMTAIGKLTGSLASQGYALFGRRANGKPLPWQRQGRTRARGGSLL